ncbi:MAG TPA: hypothetical protein VFF20_09190 [Pseudogracilibacillus sp.]|nr:hypothetical protein [Pseudogracilibacillus sp.]
MFIGTLFFITIAVGLFIILFTLLLAVRRLFSFNEEIKQLHERIETLEKEKNNKNSS